jgi:glycosyltransferase involved in cell wall biosynthesis
MCELSIVIPIYNEEHLVENYLPTIFNLPLDKEVIIVNDGSTDQTQTILEKLQAQYHFHLINQITNQGKGAAIRHGLTQITGRYFIICDADAEYDPQDIIKLLAAAQNQTPLTAIYGSRFLTNRVWSFHYLVNSFLSQLTNLLFGCHLTDMETCFKLIPAAALPAMKLKGQRFEIEPELTAQLLKAGYQIQEIPITYARRSYAEGKKIKARDGLSAIGALLQQKFTK